MSTAGEALCRDCLAIVPEDAAQRCHKCGSPRIVRHPELHELAIAHLDCDAFYASIEKRDDPSIADGPVIVGGGRRGVVAACCYVARTYGVRSAMPMFKALEACPDAVVLRPDMRKYAAEGRRIRALMLEVTPLVEPLSIDEAFLDLSGTERLHGGSPARTLARLCRRIEEETGLTVSVGLSCNKFLAKIASDLDKPRGFAVIGRSEARSFLADRPVGLIWGVGPALQGTLARDGITRIGQLAGIAEEELVARYGSMGRRLFRFARGEDDRRVTPDRPVKSVSAETTFEEDVADAAELRRILWPLCEKVSARLKRAGLVGRTVTLKLKTAQFRTLTRSRALAHPSQLAEAIYRAAEPALEAEATGTPYRLIGVGMSGLSAARGDTADLVDRMDPGSGRALRVERIIDRVRESFGEGAIMRGRALRPKPRRHGKGR